MKPSGPREDSKSKLPEAAGSTAAKPEPDEAGSPSQNSRHNAATSIQSSVSPQDYPPEERQAQVDATGAANRRR